MRVLTATVLSMCTYKTILSLVVLILLYLRFFITFVATPHLDGRDIVFGEVADDKSIAIIKKIESKADPERPSGVTFGRIFIEKAGELHR